MLIKKVPLETQTRRSTLLLQLFLNYSTISFINQIMAKPS